LAGCSSSGSRVRDTLSSLGEGIPLRRQPKLESTSAKSSNVADAGQDSPANADDVVQAAGANLSNKPTGEIAESIVARVNGDPILAQDLINPVRLQLAKAQQELPSQQFLEYRSKLLEKQLRDLVERQLLIQEAKKALPEPAIKRLESMADKDFGKRIESEMKRMEVSTESELRRKMLENGESLDQIREFQRGTFVAQQWLRLQLEQKLHVSREDMVDYYNTHKDQFQTEGGVRWSEIVVSFEKHGSRDAAGRKAQELLAQLRNGADFAELAKAESSGATADEGGQWEKTTKGSYIVAKVDEAIFTLPAGNLSQPIEGPNGWHIVRVDEKQDGGETGFVDAQDEIRRAIREQKITKESQRYVQDLARKAHITTVFDKPNQGRAPANQAK